MKLKALGKRIKTKREQAQLTQKQLANSLQISSQAISKWERGENAPDISILHHLCVLLGVTSDWLLTGYEAPKDTFEGTVFCTSIKGYAEESKSKSPKAMSTKMNHLFHQITDLVLKENGVPVKYIGDGFLAYFAGHNHGKRAVSAANACLEIIENKNLIIACHSGEIYLGSVGHRDYASLDIMGHTVNQVFMMNQELSGGDGGQLRVSGALVEG